jgi:cellulose synthase/poly-beta-1,6-N-acetylglucosamine synthase-like glycosyltransferase
MASKFASLDNALALSWQFHFRRRSFTKRNERLCDISLSFLRSVVSIVHLTPINTRRLHRKVSLVFWHAATAFQQGTHTSTVFANELSGRVPGTAPEDTDKKTKKLPDPTTANMAPNNTAAVVSTGALALALTARYTRLLVGIYANLTVKPFPVSATPTFPSQEVTVVIPTTFNTPEELAQCIECILSNNAPKEIFVVTGENNVAFARALIAARSFPTVSVLGVEKLNKRTQLLTALAQVKTPLVVFADDNVFWPQGYLPQLTAIFENPNVGAGGTCQRVRRNTSGTTTDFWNILGISYLSRRVFNNITTNAIDGSISTLSGRTAAYRTSILKCDEFSYYFTHDTWMGRPLNSDDDKCLTRYVYAHGWSIAIQISTSLETTVENNAQYLSQCLRWARAHWRGNFTVMMNETYWRSSRYAWGCYVIYASMFQTPSLLVDVSIAYLLNLALATSSSSVRFLCFAVFAAFLLFTKIVKMASHFKQNPGDIVWLPVLIALSYAHGFLNLYAVATMTTTVWGGKDLHAEAKAVPAKTEAAPLLAKTQSAASVSSS